MTPGAAARQQQDDWLAGLTDEAVLELLGEAAGPLTEAVILANVRVPQPDAVAPTGEWERQVQPRTPAERAVAATVVAARVAWHRAGRRQRERGV